jgi:hypothetical protein
MPIADKICKVVGSLADAVVASLGLMGLMTPSNQVLRAIYSRPNPPCLSAELGEGVSRICKKPLEFA